MRWTTALATSVAALISGCGGDEAAAPEPTHDPCTEIVAHAEQLADEWREIVKTEREAIRANNRYPHGYDDRYADTVVTEPMNDAALRWAYFVQEGGECLVVGDRATAQRIIDSNR